MLDSVKQMLKAMTPKRVIWMCIGVFLIGMSVSCSRLSGLGTDPFSCMNLGVSAVLRHVTNNGFFTYGNWQLIVNLILLIPMIIWMRKGLGLGTIINMVFVGYVADFCMFIYKQFGIDTTTFADFMVVRVLLIVLALVLLTLGVALYMQCDLGIAPYDSLSPIMELKTNGKIKYAIGRVITDCICVLIGFVSGSVVGVNTLIMMFGTGPFVTFFRTNVAAKVIPLENDNNK
ncbi:MAG: hypothetical protein K5656_02695 [Lachnospiraceae bacterium]|nr:hypothetical protein [Lachnospiraceae bacterium]